MCWRAWRSPLAGDGRHGRVGRPRADPVTCEIGRYARERGVQRMFATGPLSMLAVESFGAGATWYPDTDALARAVNEELRSGRDACW